MTTPRRRGEWLLLALSLVACLGVAEFAVRLLGLGRPRASGYAPVNTNRRAMRPRNSAGYRDLERTLAKPPGVRRVLSLGDSFAWGASVEFEDAYPQRLERQLTRRRREPWQVVNLALPGMNTVDQAAQLRSEGLTYDPDVVVLGYVLNDSEDETAAEARRASEWAEERRVRSAPPGMLDHSMFFRLVRGRLWATAENRRRIQGYRSMYAEQATGWVAGRQALSSLGALCRDRGLPFVVAIFPLFGNPLDETYPFEAIHRQVGSAATTAGARVIDLLPAYRGLRWDILVVDGADDEHPNEIAHRIAASTILRALDGILPGGVPKAGDDEAPAAEAPAPASPPGPVSSEAPASR